MLPLIVADGVVTEQLDVVVGALSVMASANVAFVDAFLAEVARRSSGTVASFDRDFGRLDVQWVQPD
jgi:predicted nucleic acid-binding protein